MRHQWGQWDSFACGISKDDLTTRAADVILKENQLPDYYSKLETPLSLIHINNMKYLQKLEEL